MCIKRDAWWVLAYVFILSMLGTAAAAQTTQFTYQGRLTDGGNPANGTYDLQFRVFDAAVGGTQVGSTAIIDNVAVSNGLFKVVLDFGAAAFPGADRWLEIGVRPGDSTGAFTPLSPLQQLNATPYAVRSLSAATAALADGLSVACVNCVTSSQINSVSGSQVSGAIPVASVPAGSTNYVQNTTTQQASTNFSISGNGTAGGTLGANIVNATTQFNLSTHRVLSTPGTNNLFVGVSAGGANTTGHSNVFMGTNAGGANTTGDNNSFFGYSAGANHTTGMGNSFFGLEAGFATTNGQGNTFVGASAGRANTDGVGNAIFGAASGQISTANYNSFFGHTAGWMNTTGYDNAFFGQGAGKQNTTGGRNAFFGREAGVENTTGGSNAFFGRAAGITNTTGGSNTIIGANADVGANNLIFATALGAGAIVSANNTVVLGRTVDAVQVPGSLNVAGALSGNGSALTNLNAANIASGTLAAARGGTGLSAVGAAGNYLRSDGTNWTSSLLQAADLPSGNGNYIQNTSTQQTGANFNVAGNGTAGGTLSANVVNTVTQYNLGGNRVLDATATNFYAGLNAGTVNTGNNNTFVGNAAGAANVGGNSNAFFGNNAGSSNISGTVNAFFGMSAGRANVDGGSNAFFGSAAGYSNTSASFNAFFGNAAGYANTTASDNSFFGSSAGRENTEGIQNSFFGSLAGYHNSTGNRNSFFGYYAGFGNQLNHDNAFFGYQAGQANAADGNAFLGAYAGNANTSGADNAFFGFEAGRANTLASFNAFFGARAGVANTTGVENVFLGRRAGELNTDGDRNVFVGWGAGDTNTTGDYNTALGHGTDVASNNLSHATAIGAGAVVSTSNTIVLGRSTGLDTVRVPGLGAATATHLCINTANQNELSLCSSSLRYKKNVAPLNAGLSLIQRLRPVTFAWKQSDERDLGLIAEEVAAVEPLLVTHNAAGEIQGVKYDQLSVVLINALKQQQAQIEQQQTQLATQQQLNAGLQQQLKTQQEEIADLRRLVCRAQPQAIVCRTAQRQAGKTAIKR